MSQADVIRILKKKRRWMTIKEVAKILKYNPSNINVSLLKLYEQGEIFRRERKNTIGHSPYEYKIKC